MEITPIAHIRTDMPQKFGIPRNSFVAPHLQGRIVFEPHYAVDAAVAGLEEFSHLWLLWQFENGEAGGGADDVAADATSGREGDAGAVREPAAAAVPAGRTTPAPAKWSPTVRPPRLGGAKRIGVFATRSPFRPNSLGLSCVELERVEATPEGPVIHVRGADLRDGTPIFDIKPYIPFADCHPEANGGWIDQSPWRELDVDFPEYLRACVPAEKVDGLIEVLSQDPRRAGSKHEPKRIYRMAFAGLDIGFTVDGDQLHVVSVDRFDASKLKSR